MTRTVKSRYNLAVPVRRYVALFALFMAPACTKEGHSKVDTGAIEASDRLTSGDQDGSQPVDRTPLPGFDLAKLDKKKQDSFYRLVASLRSPCGKTHSLRTSVTSDTSCRRAPFAARVVQEMLIDEATEPEVKEEYRNKYEGKTPAKTFALDGVPRRGPADAPIVFVEFFDYECPACQSLKPELDKALAEHPSDAAVYYKMFPLVAKHPDSQSAAQAALAAHAQGKFAAMHEALFEKSPAHKREDVVGYARDLGLDVAKFEADYQGAAATGVDADMKEGDAAGVDHTPTLFFNGVQYKGPHHAKYLGLWIDEEVAVNR